MMKPTMASGPDVLGAGERQTAREVRRRELAVTPLQHDPQALITSRFLQLPPS